MHQLIDQAKEIIASWTSDEPRELAIEVAALCRRTLDSGGLPNDSTDWVRLRSEFEITKGQGIGETIARWDECCRTADVDLQSNQDTFVKLGIVTWLVKYLAKRFGILPGSEPINDFDEWKHRLCDCFDKYILVSRNQNNACI